VIKWLSVVDPFQTSHPLLAGVKVERFGNDREVKNNRNGQNQRVTGKSGFKKEWLEMPVLMNLLSCMVSVLPVMIGTFSKCVLRNAKGSVFNPLRFRFS